jgi:hypothetical protein
MSDAPHATVTPPEIQVATLLKKLGFEYSAGTVDEALRYALVELWLRRRAWHAVEGHIASIHPWAPDRYDTEASIERALYWLAETEAPSYLCSTCGMEVEWHANGVTPGYVFIDGAGEVDCNNIRVKGGKAGGPAPSNK